MPNLKGHILYNSIPTPFKKEQKQTGKSTSVARNWRRGRVCTKGDGGTGGWEKVMSHLLTVVMLT